MIKVISIINHLGERIDLELSKPDKSGFIVIDVTGLGGGKSDINLYDIPMTDGSLYNSSRAQYRNIVFTIRYLDDPSVEECRRKSYRYFPLKKKITIIVHTDKRASKIDGYVESNEPNIFSEEEETQISVICPNPYFFGLEDKKREVSNYAVPMFQFPFQNEYLSRKTIQFSQLFMEDGTFEHRYDGEVETGVKILFEAYEVIKDIVIYNRTTGEKMSIDTEKLHKMISDYVKKGDKILLSTLKGERYIYLIRNGKKKNILNCVPIDSDWISLVPGINRIGYDTSVNKNYLRMTLEHPIVYEGV